MKLILKNDNSGYQKNPNVKVIETTESTFENQIVIIEENDIPVIKFTDLNTSYNIKSLQDKYRHSNSEVSIDIIEDDLEIISNGNGGGDFIPLLGTTEGNPVTGTIEVNLKDLFHTENNDFNNYFIFQPDITQLRVVNKNTNTGTSITLGNNGISISGTNLENVKGVYSQYDFSEVEPNNKLIYAQRSYVDKAISNIDFSPKFSEIVIEAETDGIEIPITGGTYMVYNFRGQTVYRYMTTATNTNGYPTQDAFYSTFDGTTLSGLITTRG